MTATNTLERPRLKVALSCHLKPVTVSVPPAPINLEQFPAAAEGFNDFVAVTQASFFGGVLTAIDISDLGREEVKSRLREEMNASHLISRIEFLQALEFLAGEYGLSAYPPDLDVRYVVAYHGDDEQDSTRVSWRPGRGFRRINPALDEGVLGAGTLGLFSLPSL